MGLSDLRSETGKVLLDDSDPTPIEKAIRRIVASEEDTALLDLHVWQISPCAHSAIVALSARNGMNPATCGKDSVTSTSWTT
jgi:Co/Zn/Cd efflux system component